MTRIVYQNRPLAAGAALHPALAAAYGLSLAILLLSVVASAAGLFIADLYRDNDWVRPQLRGNDLVTLAVAAPLLTFSLIRAMGGSPRGQLLWLGALGYMLYNYLYYALVAAFNPLFLIYVALMSMSLFALVLGLITLNWAAVARRFQVAPVGAVCVFLFVISGALGLMWTGMALAAGIAGDEPRVVEQSGHPTAVVFALDLALIVPVAALAAFGLRRRLAWAYVASAIMLVKSATYGLALLAMALFMYRAGGDVDWLLVPLWFLVAAGGIMLGGRYVAAAGVAP